MARVNLTREATHHFDALPARLREPGLNALTDLQIDPHAAGKPLLGPLKGLSSARLGSYRVIYSMGGTKRSPNVIVRAIKHRSVAYSERRRQ